MQWHYQINLGLRHPSNSKFDLLFGSPRTFLRKRFCYIDKLNKGRFENVDSYVDMLGEKGQWIRLNFKDELLFEIEVLCGEVIFADFVIKTHADLTATLDQLSKRGYLFHEWEYGYINHFVKMDLGDSGKNGGVSNLIYWILLSQDHNHIPLLS